MSKLRFWMYLMMILLVAAFAMAWARHDPPFGPGFLVGLCIAAAVCLGEEVGIRGFRPPR